MPVYTTALVNGPIRPSAMRQSRCILRSGIYVPHKSMLSSRQMKRVRLCLHWYMLAMRQKNHSGLKAESREHPRRRSTVNLFGNSEG